MCLTFYSLFNRSLWLLPVVTVSLVLMTFSTTYGIAVGLNHTQAVFPYVTKTGAAVPERGIFTIGITIAAILFCMNVEIRYEYVRLNFSQMSLTPAEKARWMTTNTMTLYLSHISVFGLFMLASFQIDTMNVPHHLGAFLTFVFGPVCCWLHSAITWKTYKEERKTEFLITFLCQIVMSFVSTCLLIIFSGSFGSYKHQRLLQESSKTDTLRDVFLTSTISEWLLAISIILFLLTFIPGFKKMEFDGIVTKWKAPGSEKSVLCGRILGCCSNV
ncbi:DNA damage-regulated autophagy modulator protein 2-like isoform X1 [Mytilus galloprovincialis]|uniref:DNA damage-regulated autophagy modulator protein 2-like isoform X1 n=1 Tax=Mytilus galloprovincialis TaxID=29158 RepID=UPI003F7C0495